MTTLFFECLYGSFIASINVLYIAFFGFLLKKLKTVNIKFENSLSRVVTNFILPCLIFTEIIKNLDVRNIDLIYEVLLGMGTIFITGTILGYACGIILNCSYNESNFLSAILSTPNAESVPFIMIEVLDPILQRFPALKSHEGLTAKQRGFLYVILCTVINNIWKWSVAYNLIDQEEKDPLKFDDDDIAYDSLDEFYLPNTNGVNIKVAVSKECKSSYKQVVDADNFNFHESGSVLTTLEPSFKDKVLKILNIPLIISGVAIIICFFPDVKRHFTDKDEMLNQTIFSIAELTSKAFTPMVILILGLSFANLERVEIKNGPNSKFITTGTLLVSTLIKLVVMPFIGGTIILYFKDHGFFSDDILVFLFMFMFACPNSINLIIVCNVKHAHINSATLVLSFQYLCGMFTLILATAGILYLLLSEIRLF